MSDLRETIDQIVFVIVSIGKDMFFEMIEITFLEQQ